MSVIPSDKKAKLIKKLKVEMSTGQRGVPLSQVRLVKVGMNDQLDSVESWTSEEMPNEAQLANLIDEEMESNADGNDEVTTIYKVLFFYGGSGKPEKEFPIRIQNASFREDPELSDYMPREGATPKGFAAQMQRHVETQFKAGIGERQETMRMLREENRELREQVARFLEKQMQLFELQQDLLDRKQERELTAKKAAATEALKQQFMEQFLPVGLVVLNRFLTKGNVDLGDNHPDIMTFKAFLATLREDDIPKLGEALGPRLIPILELVQKYKEQHETKQAKLAEMTAANIPKLPKLAGK
jgi:hypothetical protein